MALALASLVVLVVLVVWFSKLFSTFLNLHTIRPEGSELDAVFVYHVRTIFLHNQV